MLSKVNSQRKSYFNCFEGSANDFIRNCGKSYKNRNNTIIMIISKIFLIETAYSSPHHASLSFFSSLEKTVMKRYHCVRIRFFPFIIQKLNSMPKIDFVQSVMNKMIHQLVEGENYEMVEVQGEIF